MEIKATKKTRFYSEINLQKSICVAALELAYSGKKRVLATFCLSAAFVVGGMLMSMIAYFVPDWSWIYRVIAIMSAVYFPIMW